MKKVGEENYRGRKIVIEIDPQYRFRARTNRLTSDPPEGRLKRKFDRAEDALNDIYQKIDNEIK